MLFKKNEIHPSNKKGNWIIESIIINKVLIFTNHLYV